MSIPAVLMALSGATAISFQGGLTAELSTHPVKAIMDNDIAGMIKRYLEGIEISEETLAVDLINEIGPMPGSFLDTDHTLEWWRKECYIPAVAVRESHETWENGGKKTALHVAREKYESIIKNYKPTMLEQAVEDQIEIILQDARNYYRKKGMISDEEWRIYEKDLNSPNYPFA